MWIGPKLLQTAKITNKKCILAISIKSTSGNTKIVHFLFLKCYQMQNKQRLKVLRLKATILGLKFVNLVRPKEWVNFGIFCEILAIFGIFKQKQEVDFFSNSKGFTIYGFDKIAKNVLLFLAIRGQSNLATLQFVTIWQTRRPMSDYWVPM